MKRTTVSLPDDLSFRVEREARQRHVSVSEVVRQALIDHLELDASEPRRLPFASLGHYEGRYRARDMEQILEDEWRSHRTRDS